ncbi:unnamed protein product [Arabis nemorensis]|uniref:Uncharacterized protein n=1 Tax=Arabis nemorensis TaxID=586526 RepID=A0A565CIL7_9BRAS|nr:unnamed protein product [Arabis nemorensis]
MTLPTIPRDIMKKIVTLVGEEGHEHLAAWIFMEREGRDMVYSVGTCFIRNLCSELEYIFPGENGRPFFQRCLEADNPEAVYSESLRLALSAEDFEGAIDLLDTNVPKSSRATFVAAIFSVCADKCECANEYFTTLFATFAPHDSPRIRELGDSLLERLIEFKPTYSGFMLSPFRFPVCPSVPWPDCSINCYICGNMSCNHCYLYWCTREIVLMICD